MHGTDWQSLSKILTGLTASTTFLSFELWAISLTVFELSAAARVSRMECSDVAAWVVISGKVDAMWFESDSYSPIPSLCSLPKSPAQNDQYSRLSCSKPVVPADLARMELIKNIENIEQCQLCQPACSCYWQLGRALSVLSNVIFCRSNSSKGRVGVNKSKKKLNSAHFLAVWGGRLSRTVCSGQKMKSVGLEPTTFRTSVGCSPKLSYDSKPLYYSNALMDSKFPSKVTLQLHELILSSLEPKLPSDPISHSRLRFGEVIAGPLKSADGVAVVQKSQENGEGAGQVHQNLEVWREPGWFRELQNESQQLFKFSVRIQKVPLFSTHIVTLSFLTFGL